MGVEGSVGWAPPTIGRWAVPTLQRTGIVRESPVPDPQTPDWVRDAIFYQIFPDRFARSLMVPKPSRLDPWGATPTWYGYQGGDLVGVIERLDYLCDLGVNAIYFTPIFQS